MLWRQQEACQGVPRAKLCGRNPSEASGFQKSAQKQVDKAQWQARGRDWRKQTACVGRRRVLNLSVLAYCCSQQLENLSSGTSGSSPGSTIGESPAKTWGLVRCTDTIQAHSLSCLTLVYKELGCPRGCFLTRRHNVTQTHGSSSGHASVGRSDEPEDGSCHPR